MQLRFSDDALYGRFAHFKDYGLLPMQLLFEMLFVGLLLPVLQGNLSR
jgi:hypothetical protein